LPKIIRSSGVNIERARPIVVPLREAVEEPAPEPMEARKEPAVEVKQPDMEQIYASAKTIVENIISKARNDADNMLVDARQETIKVLQDAVREGWDQGVSEALKEMHAIQEAAALEIDTAIESLIQERKQLIKDLEHDVVELVFDVVEKVLTVEMDRSDAWIEAMVRTALAEMDGDDSIVMKVAAPVRQKVIEIARNMLSATGKQPSRLSVAGDSGLTSGACIIETPKGVIDTSVENKLGKLKTAMRENA
jgi:flagellar assembly protein FliH